MKAKPAQVLGPLKIFHRPSAVLSDEFRGEVPSSRGHVHLCLLSIDVDGTPVRLFFDLDDRRGNVRAVAIDKLQALADQLDVLWSELWSEEVRRKLDRREARRRERKLDREAVTV